MKNLTNPTNHPQTPRPLLISGPSGTGKGSLIKRLLSDYPSIFSLSVSHTTRPPRKEDKNGITYNFISKEAFKKDIKKGNFLEHVEYSGNYYGTNRKQFSEIRKNGKICIIEVEMNSARKIFEQGIDCRFVFVLPPSVEQLRERLLSRDAGVDLESVERRVEIGRREIRDLERMEFFERVFVNRYFELFYAKVVAWLIRVYPEFGF